MIQYPAKSITLHCTYCSTVSYRWIYPHTHTVYMQPRYDRVCSHGGLYPELIGAIALNQVVLHPKAPGAFQYLSFIARTGLTSQLDWIKASLGKICSPNGSTWNYSDVCTHVQSGWVVKASVSFCVCVYILCAVHMAYIPNWWGVNNKSVEDSVITGRIAKATG